MKKVYICGKITGLEKSLYTQIFKDAQVILEEKGYIVVNPVTLCEEKNLHGWIECMRACIKALMDCDTIFVLNNSSSSKGANVERFLAHILKFKFLYQYDID